MTPDRIDAMVELSRAFKAMLDADAYLESNIAARDYHGCEEGYVMREQAAERLDKALSAWYYGGASGQITTARATTPFMTRVTAQLINEKARGTAGDAEGGK